MKIKLSLVLALLALVLLAFFSKKLFYFRWIGYELIPPTTNILDEKNYVAAGYSFRKTGIPTAWSNLNSYKKIFDEKKITGSSILTTLTSPSTGKSPV